MMVIFFGIHDPFTNMHGLTLPQAWISNHMACEMWDEITYPFANFNGSTA